MTRSWEEMLSNPIEGEEYNGQVSESEQVMCNFCVANNKAVHFPNDGEFYCSECFHGVSLEKAIRIEGCETCELSYESERASEPLCGDHIVPVSQCNCLWGYKRERGSK